MLEGKDAVGHSIADVGTVSWCRTQNILSFCVFFSLPLSYLGYFSSLKSPRLTHWTCYHCVNLVVLTFQFLVFLMLLAAVCVPMDSLACGGAGAATLKRALRSDGAMDLQRFVSLCFRVGIICAS